MRFGGIQKLTLLDFPGKVACTLFTVGCNYRCPFCHNASLVCQTKDASTIDEKEVLDFLITRQGLLDGVCITGGEPLLHDDLESFITEVRALGFSVKLDTNGSDPQKLQSLIERKMIDYVSMDIKNVPEKYAQTIGLSSYDTAPIEESIALLLSASIPYEFRTTVVREFHTQEDLVALARWLTGTKAYYLQKYVDSPDILEQGLHGYSDSEMQHFCRLVQKILPTAELRGL